MSKNSIGYILVGFLALGNEELGDSASRDCFVSSGSLLFFIFRYSYLIVFYRSWARQMGAGLVRFRIQSGL